MTIRFPLIFLAVCALAACQPAVPDSGAGVVDTGRGVGFDDPSSLAARQAREAELSGTTIAGPNAGATSTIQSAGTVRAVSDPAGLDAELAQGELSSATQWLANAVQRHGSALEPRTVIEAASGGAVSEKPLLDYLDAKFGALYAL